MRRQLAHVTLHHYVFGRAQPIVECVMVHVVEGSADAGSWSAIGLYFGYEVGNYGFAVLEYVDTGINFTLRGHPCSD